MADENTGCGCSKGNVFGNYITYCECLLERINNLNVILTGMISSYRLLVGAAEEFNRITLAHKNDLEAAIDRADEMGDIIDLLLCRMKHLIKVYLDVCFQELMCPDIPAPGTATAGVVIPNELVPEIALDLQTGQPTIIQPLQATSGAGVEKQLTTPTEPTA